MVAGLAETRRWRTWGSRSRCPCRSIASMRLGRTAFNRFPQMRSDVSQTTIRASRAASS